MPEIRILKNDRLNIRIFETRQELGREAAVMFRDEALNALKTKDELNVVFASAPSQNEFLASLLEIADFPWNRLNAFHLDEYVGLPADAPQGFGNYIRDRLWGRIPLKSVNYMNGLAMDLHAECHRYGDLLCRHPIDLLCFGIGENGHLAFNDPPVADFKDPEIVKCIVLETACRQQQVNDGCFRTLQDVPVLALTLTIPAIMGAKVLLGMVPGPTKAEAVRRTLSAGIGSAVPSTILRSHPNATILLDSDSAELLS